MVLPVATHGRLLITAVMGCCCLVSARSHATIMIPLSLKDMADEAVAVVRARVVAKASHWDEKHERIFTTTTLSLVDVIHAYASLPKEIRVSALGGEVDGIGMRVAGTPTFSEGEDVLVFLRDDPRRLGDYQVIGMSQGVYRIVKAHDGVEVALSAREGIAFVRQGQDGVMRVDEKPTPKKEMSFVQLRDEIVRLTAGKDTRKAIPGAVPQANPIPVLK